MHQLVALVNTLVGDDPTLKARLDRLSSGPSFTDQRTSSRTTINSVAHRAYEEILQKPLVYRRNVRAHDIDSIYSYGTSQLASLALSRFSDLSFGNVSAISVFCLPVWSEDLSNATHYRFGRGGLRMTLAELTEKYPTTDPLELDTIDGMSVYKNSGPNSLKDLIYSASATAMFMASSITGGSLDLSGNPHYTLEEGTTHLDYRAREACNNNVYLSTMY